MHPRTREALADGAWDRILWPVAGVVSFASGVGAVAVVHDRSSSLELVDAIVGVAGIGIPFAIFAFCVRVIAAPIRVSRELERLTTLPFRFDRDGYLAMLAKDRSFGALAIDVRFVARPVGVRFDEALRAAGIVDSRWLDERTLHVVGPTLSTDVSAPHEIRRSNAIVHRWFSGRAVPMLLALHAVAPVAEVALEV